jgi:hypothetical protein
MDMRFSEENKKGSETDPPIDRNGHPIVGLVGGTVVRSNLLVTCQPSVAL